ncbi:hypothetical protein ABZ478_38325 [Streptomyces sp. NPDC005706]|uniref:hypothetical protein n=1 Tax=Streptomyces sp. NPDC005706 TaxID=3157169 RepID=UPI0033F48334
MAAIGGLVFTGVATYYGAVVSRQQLDQVKGDQEHEEQQQASRITTWTDPDASDGKLHVVNRSPDPATSASVTIGVERAVYVFQIPTLPPCSELSLQAKDIRFAHGTYRFSLDAGVWRADLLQFTDATGQTWQRTPEALEKIDFAASVVPYFPQFKVTPLDGECGYT